MKEIKIQSFSDVITNSSSELFVFNDGKSVDEVIEHLDKIYPNWRMEYNTPIMLKDADEESLSIYLDEVYGLGWGIESNEVSYIQHNRKLSNMPTFRIYCWSSDNKRFADQFDKNNCYASAVAREIFGMEPEEAYCDWEKYNPFGDWEDGCMEYVRVNPDALATIAKNIKDTTNVLLFSLSENPSYEWQEALEQVARRYHLG